MANTNDIIKKVEYTRHAYVTHRRDGCFVENDAIPYSASKINSCKKNSCVSEKFRLTSTSLIKL